MIKKVDIKDLNIKSQIHNGYKANVYELENGSILKAFSPLVLNLYKSCDIQLERKIIESKPIINVPEIIVPEEAVYENQEFLGYTSKKAEGIDYNTYDDFLTLKDRCNLKQYADEYSKLESIIKRGNKENIVFPDLCSCDNIFIDDKGNMSLIDYDGLQIDNFITPILSSSLGDQDQYFCPKYYDGKIFTSELDKKSLIVLYFLNTFNVDITKVGSRNPITGEIVTLDDIFELINLDNCDIQNKVWKCLQDKYENEFLEDDVYDIAYDYNMVAFPTANKTYLKKLIKK